MTQAVRCPVAMPTAFHQLPLSVNSRPSKVAAVLRFALAVPALALVAVVVAAVATLGEEALIMARQHPGAALQAITGLAVCAALFVLPVLRSVQAMLHRQTICIDTDGVRVAERRFLRQRGWSAPLADFRGICRVVRTTVSGQRHELVLLPRRRGRPLLLLAAEHIAQDTVDRLAKLLRLPALPAGDLQRPRRRQTSDAAPPLRAAVQAGM